MSYGEPFHDGVLWLVYVSTMAIMMWFLASRAKKPMNEAFENGLVLAWGIMLLVILGVSLLAGLVMTVVVDLVVFTRP